MKISRKQILTVLILVFVASTGHAANFEFLKLKVFKDLKPGMWSLKFSAVPKSPSVPSSSTTECLDKKEMAERFHDTLNQGPQPCQIKNVTDGVASAQMTMVCPPIQMPELKIKTAGSNMPIKIRKLSNTQWTLQIDVPSRPGFTPKSTWLQEYTWLKPCGR
ncbi:MAG: hypothetical protein EOP04_23630 [Proteobacteria bacterium]|nr:MAG: hypothetical protein EOP04_23630 [Pseudomonadota bacterium]